jgi:hypothetical protein
MAQAEKPISKINAVPGADVERLIKDIYAIPQDIVAKAKQAATLRRSSSPDN